MKNFKTENEVNGNTLNGMSLSGALILAGVIFSAISPWWLVLGIPLQLVGYNTEVKVIKKLV